MKNFKILNDYSIRSKLLLIYLICVLVPMIVTNSIFYITIRNSEEKEQRINMEHSIDRVKYNLGAVFDDCVLVSDHLYRDLTLNEFITKRYDNLLTYYDRYIYLLQNNVIKYYYRSQHVYQVTIFTDNNTISDSDNFIKLTPQIRNSEWYKQFKDNKEAMIISVFYDKDKKYSINNMARTISIIRKLDNFDKTHENILRIDIDYNIILNDIFNEKMEDNLYICNKDFVLFSNQKSGVGADEFDSINSINEENVKLNDFYKFKALNEKWNIIITEKDVNPFSKITEKKELFIGLVILNLLLPTIIIALISHSIGNRITLLNIYLRKVENEEFSTIDEYGYGKDEIGNLIRSYNLMVLRIKELIEVVFKRDAEKQRLELAKKQAELKALQSQVNPHFMFNTLESIRMRSLIKGEDETAEIIENLSALLRKTINWGEDYITIEDELLFVENYLQIQKYRFGDKLSFDFYVTEKCKSIRIPKLSILSFVENACVHGIEEVSHNASINIAIFKYDNNLIIEISDTGIGMDEGKLNSIREKLNNAEIDTLNNSKSTGVLNTYMRLQMYCNNSMKFEIDSKLREGTEVTMQICLDELKLNG
ncbi:sensor histidine kinase [Clostridium beijerinckii]|uniref:Sensor histidine kinase n=1 Tax=Clostridium beijerinckii TaxID=1520 RepID=A0A1S8P8Q7_CLOBE|nr:sensor histidine kinase [Clostridium beijerinckii]MCI1477068.1 sensor histidine kinase [Clostridium beijerinckii]MCI1577559.1 sensor histidine kinase [Clostridium beijerinckii]MCI1583619.1 sensor histidine kinase [Clostridium beijerinckii]MCI1621232.1 sensor histidine kinase [Clostridium beijerinckii]NMF05873.1 sensor histidine kinase [Clostridium beijerinckii]